MILPHLNYGILCWGSPEHRIFTLQKKAVRIISRAKYNAHTSPLFKSLNLLKIHDISTINKLKFYFKLAHRLVPSYFLDSFISFNNEVHEHGTRHSSFLRIPVHKHVFFQQCLRYSLVKSVNECEFIILEKIHTHSLFGFSEYAKRFFLLIIIPNHVAFEIAMYVLISFICFVYAFDCNLWGFFA